MSHFFPHMIPPQPSYAVSTVLLGASMNISSRRRAFIAGTLMLTAAGFSSRILGFFYRIYLSRTIGAEGLGVYNMIHPIFGVCFALCAGSIQTAISRFVAANVRQGKAIFRTGLLISLSMSLVLAAAICRFAPFLAEHVLLEPRCAPLLPIMAFSVPCAAVHACINGCYYGLQRTKVPAFTQLAEQAVRIGAVFLIADILTEQGQPITVRLAVYGHLIGEFAATLFSLLSFALFPPRGSFRREPGGAEKRKDRISPVSAALCDFTAVAPGLMALALPLMGNRLVLNLLSSAEAVLIPNRLLASGLSSEEAYSLYGVLTGMALPFIFFPSAITNSMSVLLLPTVAEAQSAGNRERISSAVTLSLRYSLYMGIFCIGIFTRFGHDLGVSVFREETAGYFIAVLSWLCPFLYLSSTTGSILNGLGATGLTFLQNAAALSLRLGFVFFGIPRFGIAALLWGMLASEIFLSLAHLAALRRRSSFLWDAWSMIVKPSAVLILSFGILNALLSLPAASLLDFLPPFFAAAVKIGIAAACYGGLLLTLCARQPYSKDVP